MLVDFSSLPETSSVWIYQAEPSFSEDQELFVRQAATRFCEGWQAHGAPLKSSFKVMHHKFLVLIVDEGANAASGCSIDSSVHFVKELEAQLDINFFDRTKVAFLIDERIYTTDLQSIKNDISAGKIEPESITFNLQAQNLREFSEKWLIEARESWMKKYF